MARVKEVLANIFAIPELRRRIIFTIAMLAVFRLGYIIPVPGVKTDILAKMIDDFSKDYGRLVGIFSMLSGGALSQFSIFSLGIMPYITASIMFSLLVKVIPSLEALSKEGPAGYRKISQYTRLATVPICVFWSIWTALLLQRVDPRYGSLVYEGGGSFLIVTICSLTAGAVFLMWLGEQITEYGLGNGASLIIMAGIIDRMPGAVGQIVGDINTGKLNAYQPIILLVLYLFVIVAIVYMTQAQRRVPVQYAKHVRGNRVYGGQRHYLPLRVNHAGVMPVIFASTLMVVPQLMANMLGSEMLKDMFSKSESGFWYCMIYMGLIFFFAYFWTALYFRPAEMSEHLQEWGSFVPGLRPGRDTANHLEMVMNRITLSGAAFLAIIALLPNIVSEMLGVGIYATRFLGGTGILIVVGVGLDLMQKVESHLLIRDYEGLLDKGRLRGRR